MSVFVVYVCMYARVSKHTYIYICMDMFIVRAVLHAFIDTYRLTHAHTYIHTRMHTCIHTYMHTCPCTPTRYNIPRLLVQDNSIQ